MISILISDKEPSDALQSWKTKNCKHCSMKILPNRTCITTRSWLFNNCSPFKRNGKDPERPQIASRRKVVRSSCMTMPSHMLLKRLRKHCWTWNGKFSNTQLTTRHCSFWLSSIQIEHGLSGERFSNAAEMCEMNRWMDQKMIFFRRGICELPERWETVVKNDGKYFWFMLYRFFSFQ